MPRRARVTFEGEVVAYVDRPVKRITLQLDDNSKHTFYGEPAEIKFFDPPRVWTDGDLLQHTAALSTLTRIGGVWHHSDGITFSDNWVNEKMRGGLWKVIKYRHDDKE